MSVISTILSSTNNITRPLIVKPYHEVFVKLGSMDADGVAVAEDFGGGTVRVGVAVNGGGGYQSIKDITSLTAPTDKAARFAIEPNSNVVLILSGATGGSLYAELSQSKRETD